MAIVTPRRTYWCTNLFAVLAAVSLVTTACGKKKSKSDTADDGENSADQSVDNAVVTDAASIVIPGTLNMIPPKGGDNPLDGLGLTGPGDYASDWTNYHLKEDMFEPIDNAIGILCFISQSRGMKFINQGAYTAYIDESACDMGGGDDQPQGAVSYKPVKVNVTQEGTKAPKVVLWINEEGGKQIYAELIIAAGPSDDNPLGLLRLSWNQGDNHGGYIETRKLANPEKDGRNRVELLMRSDEGHGSDVSSQRGFASVYVKNGEEPSDGYVSTSSDQTHDNGKGPEHKAGVFKAAFNSGHVVRTGSITNNDGTSDAGACLSRDTFINTARRYNLYQADGTRVELNSGKPGECVVDGKTVQTNFSYWGIWNSANATSSDLKECKFVEFPNGNRVETPVSIVSAPGKLVKYTRAQTTLGALKNMELSSYGNNGNTIIKWTGSDFQKIATETNNGGNNGPTRTPASGKVEGNDWDGSLNFYVPTLDAQMSIKVTAASDSYVIYYFNRETVSGTGNEPTENLLCFANCPVAKPTADQMNWMWGQDVAQSPYVTTTVTYNGNQTQRTTNKQDMTAALATYTFDASALVIKLDGTAFELPSGLASDSRGMISSGALIPNSAYVLLTPDQKSTTNGGEAERLVTTFYRWESGANSWSQFNGIKKDGTFVNFDKPLDLSYTFVAGDNMNASQGSEFYGAPVRLNYGGVGSLWGIPSTQNGDFMPKFSLKAGTVIGDYKVKPTEVAQAMSADDATNCAGLDAGKAPNLDSLPPLTTPTVTTAPEGVLPLLVIGGELVTQ